MQYISRTVVAVPFLWLAACPFDLAGQNRESLRPVGLQDKKVTSLGFYNSFYAGTENEGVFRRPLFSPDTTWIPMGLTGKKILTVYPHKFGPIGSAVSVGVQPDWSQGDSALIYCSIFDKNEWAVTDSGLNRRAVLAIKSLDGFPDPTICGETFAAGPGKIFRRNFLSPHWEEVFDIGLGSTHVIRANEYSADVWAGGATAIFSPWLARSKDKGASWDVFFPVLGSYVEYTCRAITIHPDHPDTLFAALDEIVIKTVDGGQNWSVTGLSAQGSILNAIALDPLNTNHLLAGGSNNDLNWELWESFDEGATWQEVPPPLDSSEPVSAISSIIVSPDTIGAFFIATLGNGVWRYQTSTTAVEDKDFYLPVSFALEQNYPNPFNPETEIHYHIAVPQHVEVAIFDVNGRWLATLVEALQPAGEYRMRWNGQDANGVQLPTGVYFCQLRAGKNIVLARKMMLLR